MERRPAISMIRTIKGMTRKLAEVSLGEKITKHEWAKANQHTKLYGRGMPVKERRKWQRMKVDRQEIEKIFIGI